MAILNLRKDFSLSLVSYANLSHSEYMAISEFGFKSIDVNPNLIGIQGDSTIDKSVRDKFFKSINDSGLKINSIQGLLFGQTLDNFDSINSILDRFKALTSIAKSLECTNLVLGAPSLRKSNYWQNMIDTILQLINSNNLILHMENICPGDCSGGLKEHYPGLIENSSNTSIGRIIDYSNYLDCTMSEQFLQGLNFNPSMFHFSGSNHSIPTESDFEALSVFEEKFKFTGTRISIEVLNLPFQELITSLQKSII